MRRREFISLFGGSVAWPLAARAQQAVMPVIGFMSAGSPETYPQSLVAFRKALNDIGVRGEAAPHDASP
jgi:putative ABC transport system substrate-binding protein